jgi:signal transduction histidine kinase
MSLTIAPTPVGPLVESVVTGAAEWAGRRGVHLTAHVAPDVSQVMGDAERLRWVMNQLVSNAIKFTPQGGHVTVSVGLVEQRVRWSVADTGPGIPDDKLAELFKAFHQLDGSATRQQGGTGIGLALVKMIVEAHDSHVVVETAVGEGSRFSFDLPAIPS